MTASDDGTLRVWTIDGEQQRQVEYSGGTSHALVADEYNKVVLLATMDHVIHVLDVE